MRVVRLKLPRSIFALWGLDFVHMLEGVKQCEIREIYQYDYLSILSKMRITFDAELTIPDSDLAPYFGKKTPGEVLLPPQPGQERDHVHREAVTVLKKAKFGMNISQIATELDVSRNTVKNHLAALERTKSIQVFEFGRSKVIFLPPELANPIDATLGQDKKDPLLNLFTANLLKALDDVDPKAVCTANEPLAKIIGKQMEPYFSLPMGESLDEPLHLERSEIFPFLGNMARQLVPIIYRIWLPVSIEFIPPHHDYDEMLMVRVEIHCIVPVESLFQLLVGLFEAKMNKLVNLGFFVRLHEFHKQEGKTYFEVSYRGDDNSVTRTTRKNER
jgi:hypothetical protein